MKFSDIVSAAKALLQQKGRITRRALAREFALEADALQDLVDELVLAERVAIDEGGQVLATLGPPDLLINNAALMNAPAPLWKVPAAEFGALIDANIKGVANLLRHFVPAMIAQGRGVIVNFSSGWGRGTAPNVAPYCASKWAIEGLTRALAQELPAGMAAIPLDPGIIDTDMLRTSFGEEAGQYESPATWARRAAPFLLKLGPKHNGKALAVE